jgi:hypothetical protein
MHESNAGPGLWILLIVSAVVIGIPAVTIAAAVLLRARPSRAEFAGSGAGAAAGGAASPTAEASTAEASTAEASTAKASTAEASTAGPSTARPDVSAARTQASRVTRFGLAGLGAGVLLGLALVLQNQAGLAALTCGAGYLIGLLAGEYAAQPPARGQQRAAALHARRPGDYVPRWAAAVVLAAALLMLAAVIVFALAPPIRYGPWRPVPGQSIVLPGGTTSWPGLRPASAGLVFAAVVLLLGLAAFRRIASRPQLTDPGQQALDELLRRQAGRAITGAVLSLQLMLLAAYLLAGSAGLAVPTAAVSPGVHLGNRIMVLAGLACAAGSIVSWLVLSGWMRRRPAAVPSAEAMLRPEG